MSGIIVDIDGTLLAGANGIRKTIEYINSQKSRYDIFLVTGRPESDRNKTVTALEKNGVHYNRLFMNPKSGNTPEFKHETAQRLLLKQRIVLAIDNDEKARNAYKSLGIKTVSPDRLPV